MSGRPATPLAKFTAVGAWSIVAGRVHARLLDCFERIGDDSPLCRAGLTCDWCSRDPLGALRAAAPARDVDAALSRARQGRRERPDRRVHPRRQPRVVDRPLVPLARDAPARALHGQGGAVALPTRALGDGGLRHLPCRARQRDTAQWHAPASCSEGEILGMFPRGTSKPDRQQALAPRRSAARARLRRAPRAGAAAEHAATGHATRSRCASANRSSSSGTGRRSPPRAIDRATWSRPWRNCEMPGRHPHASVCRPPHPPSSLTGAVTIPRSVTRGPYSRLLSLPALRRIRSASPGCSGGAQARGGSDRSRSSWPRAQGSSGRINSPGSNPVLVRQALQRRWEPAPRVAPARERLRDGLPSPRTAAARPRRSVRPRPSAHPPAALRQGP